MTASFQIENSSEKLLARVVPLVADVMSVPMDDISPDTNMLTDLDANSMDVVTLIAALSDEFSVEIDIEELPEAGVNIEWIVKELQKRLG